ncbi:MAG TPA: hypothetical protein VFY39_17380 [Gammaproteobacteria bacterium]|nr:hypothetical protein [Gammaproteobacteria bacterium]
METAQRLILRRLGRRRSLPVKAADQHLQIGGDAGGRLLRESMQMSIAIKQPPLRLIRVFGKAP